MTAAALHLATPARPQVNLAALDLNLLVALEALLDHRNVTHAGQQIGLSQPAMSRALSRLRGMFDDDILVRTSTGFTVTPRGEQIAARLPQALSAVRDLLVLRQTAVDNWQATINVVMPDHQTLLLLPRLLPRLRTRAPDVQLVTHSLFAGALKRLEAGEIDYAIGQVVSAPSGFYRRSLYVDQFACLLRRDHPVLDQSWGEESFASLRHAVVAPGSEEGFGQVFDALSGLALPDANPLIVPNMMAAPVMVAETDLCLIVPQRVAMQAASMLPLTVMDVPVDLPPYEVSLIWHERNHRDAGHALIRAEIASAALAVVRNRDIARDMSAA
ncbi:DNA-binding transcriptional regulator, LysR family [Arboricoccus pini]|uniref:DNA-binding transcriptional regulator, LysR family n=1 Tax=Arboricoccus pini TaxID=1963835 RepID=A0A212RQ47_9PROT|nr:LysR family transcriptional regulator [Arboricoccus pini]SNB74685.1 DNA-binding transcriptional regulator, LysR family [Arboricoccus pini]